MSKTLQESLSVDSLRRGSLDVRLLSVLLDQFSSLRVNFSFILNIFNSFPVTIMYF